MKFETNILYVTCHLNGDPYLPPGMPSVDDSHLTSLSIHWCKSEYRIKEATLVNYFTIDCIGEG